MTDAGLSTEPIHLSGKFTLLTDGIEAAFRHETSKDGTPYVKLALIKAGERNTFLVAAVKDEAAANDQASVWAHAFLKSGGNIQKANAALTAYRLGESV